MAVTARYTEQIVALVTPFQRLAIARAEDAQGVSCAEVIRSAIAPNYPEGNLAQNAQAKVELTRREAAAKS